MAEDETAEKASAINWVQVIAGSLAAVSSAVLLSTLGVAGTLVGAAMGSVIASVASTVYSRGISISGEQVRFQAAALRRVTTARSQLDEAMSAMTRGETGAQTRVRAAGFQLDEAEHALRNAQDGENAAHEPPAEPVSRGWRDRLPGLSWKRVAVVAAGVFFVTMAVITAFELSTGRPVSSYTGGSDRDAGTTVPGLRNSGQSSPEPQPLESPTTDPSETSSGSPSDSPSESPTGDPTTDLTATPTESPTEEPSEEPTGEPSVEPTPEVSPAPDAAADVFPDPDAAPTPPAA